MFLWKSRSSSQETAQANFEFKIDTCPYTADMRVGEERLNCKLEEAGETLIPAAMGQMDFSAKGHHRVLKLGRTIAGLVECKHIQAAHIAQALQYRSRVLS